MRSTSLLASMALLVASATGGGADSAYVAEDIVEKFGPTVEAQLTRGVCIGTAEECAREDAGPAVEPPTFDLLITFEFDSDVLSEQARTNLDEFAEALRDDRLADARFAVEGHTDAHGAERYNVGLSERRAKAVVAYLTERGADPDRLIAEGLGQDAPRTDDPFDPLNRRVEARLLNE